MFQNGIGAIITIEDNDGLKSISSNIMFRAEGLPDLIMMAYGYFVKMEG